MCVPPVRVPVLNLLGAKPDDGPTLRSGTQDLGGELFLTHESHEGRTNDPEEFRRLGRFEESVHDGESMYFRQPG